MLVLALAAGAARAGEVELISRARPGAASETAMKGGSSPVVSADGRFVAFFSAAPNLVAGWVDGPEFTGDLFLHDRVTGTHTLLSHRAGAPAAAAGVGFAPPPLFAPPALSADGRYVAFISDGTDLVPGQVDTPSSIFNPHPDVFLFDRQASELTLVSRSTSSPTTTGNGASGAPAISADGRYVAFISMASDLVAGQNESVSGFDVFLFDRDTGTTFLVSHSAGSPTTAANRESLGLSMSADGRYVAFVSFGTDLFTGQTDSASPDAFLYDRLTGTITLVSAQPGSPTSGAGLADRAVISADGSRIAFSSTSPSQVAGQVDFNSSPDIFLWDRASGTTTLVSHAVGSATTTADEGTFGEVAISGNGSQVAYVSYSQDLVAGFVPGFEAQLFVFDAASGTNSLVSHTSASPTHASDGRTEQFALAADGSRIAFTSLAVDLVAGQVDYPGPFSQDIFVWERTSGAVTLASHAHSSATTAVGGSSASVSADGEVIVYDSAAPNLEAALVDANSASDVFAFDPGDGGNTALSRHGPGLASSTAVGDSDLWAAPAVSADGRFVTFGHSGGPLLAGQSGGGGVYLVDRELETTTLVSHASSSPLVSANDSSGLETISDDGRYVAFSSFATNLVSGFTDNGYFNGDVFLFDRDTGAVTLVSHAAGSATTAANGFSSAASISGDGRFVAFSSGADNLMAGQSDANSASDVFLYDRTTGSSVLVSHSAASATTVGSGVSFSPVISRDGKYVAFTSTAGNLLASGPTGPGLYLYDRALGTNILVSRSASDPAASVGGEAPALSADGRFVAFSSLANNLVPGQTDTNGADDVFLFDRQTGAVTLVSHLPGAPAATSADHTPFGPVRAAISRDGRFVAFASRAADLVPGQSDANDLDDVFLFDRLTGALALVSHKLGQPTVTGDLGSSAPALNADGSFIAFYSAADDLAAQPISSPAPQVFLYDRGARRAKLASRALASEHLPGNREAHWLPQISADGRHVLFGSYATNLVENDFNDALDVFAFTDVPQARAFYTLTPCRLFDSRAPGAGGPLVSGVKALLPAHGACGVPATAAALSVNVTATQPTGAGHLTLFAGDLAAPDSSTINFGAGQTRANNAILPLATDGTGTLAVLPLVLGGGSVHVVLDVNGWFE